MVNPRVRLIYKITSQSYLSWLLREAKNVSVHIL